MAKPYWFEVYKSLSPYQPRQWYWRLRASNGKMVADGSEGYSSKRACMLAAKRVIANLTATIPAIRVVG